MAPSIGSREVTIVESLLHAFSYVPRNICTWEFVNETIHCSYLINYIVKMSKPVNVFTVIWSITAVWRNSAFANVWNAKYVGLIPILFQIKSRSHDQYHLIVVHYLFPSKVFVIYPLTSTPQWIHYPIVDATRTVVITGLQSRAIRGLGWEWITFFGINGQVLSWCTSFTHVYVGLPVIRPCDHESATRFCHDEWEHTNITKMSL